MSPDSIHVGIDIGGSSVKCTSLRMGGEWGEVTSTRYDDPSREEIINAIRGCLSELRVDRADRVGLCLPGTQNETRTAIEWSANIPSLNGWSFTKMLGACFDDAVPTVRVVSDADAAGYDYACRVKLNGRTAAISLGTGVGLCVLDHSSIVRIGESGHIGHLGHMDVGRHGSEDRIHSSGARNILESYIGAPALRQYQTDQEGWHLDLSGLTPDDPPISAIIHAMRVVHAIYLPKRIVLMGGVGLALKPLLNEIYRGVEDSLTPLRRGGWLLECAESQYHAARGACRLSAED